MTEKKTRTNTTSTTLYSRASLPTFVAFSREENCPGATILAYLQQISIEHTILRRHHLRRSHPRKAVRLNALSSSTSDDPSLHSLYSDSRHTHTSIKRSTLQRHHLRRHEPSKAARLNATVPKFQRQPFSPTPHSRQPPYTYQPRLTMMKPRVYCISHGIQAPPYKQNLSHTSHKQSSKPTPQTTTAAFLCSAHHRTNT